MVDSTSGFPFAKPSFEQEVSTRPSDDSKGVSAQDLNQQPAKQSETEEEHK